MGTYFNVREHKIYAYKYYPYFYTHKYEVNLVPISYYTLDQARITLASQFNGEGYRKYIGVIKGKHALERGWSFGKIGIVIEGKYYQIRKLRYSPELSMNKTERWNFRWEVKQMLKNKSVSKVNNFLKRYAIWTM